MRRAHADRGGVPDGVARRRFQERGRRSRPVRGRGLHLPPDHDHGRVRLDPQRRSGRRARRAAPARRDGHDDARAARRHEGGEGVRLWRAEPSGGQAGGGEEAARRAASEGHEHSLRSEGRGAAALGSREGGWQGQGAELARHHVRRVARLGPTRLQRPGQPGVRLRDEARGDLHLSGEARLLEGKGGRGPARRVRGRRVPGPGIRARGDRGVPPGQPGPPRDRGGHRAIGQGRGVHPRLGRSRPGHAPEARYK